MRQVTNRSYVNMNRVGTYNRSDARMDNPHLPAKELGEVVRQSRHDIEGTNMEVVHTIIVGSRTIERKRPRMRLRSLLSA